LDNSSTLIDLLRAKISSYLEGEPSILFDNVVISVSRSTLPEVAKILSTDPELAFDYLRNLTAVDYITFFEMVYVLYSFAHDFRLVLKTKVSKEYPVVTTVSNLWNAANWHEREVYDLFGIEFIGHPNLTRILLPDDWEGHPLRKDYPIQGPMKETPVRWDDLAEKYRKMAKEAGGEKK